MECLPFAKPATTNEQSSFSDQSTHRHGEVGLSLKTGVKVREGWVVRRGGRVLREMWVREEGDARLK